ncbi:MAG: hypothetical protein KBT36_16760 [Kurthia sp.]|nr:hypothetical protein [Candidatus Kurthia equi]
MKKKLLYGLIATILAATVLVIYFEANGNPAEKKRAKTSLETYLQKTYPEMDYKINWGGKYSSVDDSYNFEVVTKNEYDVESIYPFDVYRYEPHEVFNDTIHKSRIDKEASKELNKQAQIYIKQLIEKELPLVGEVGTDIEVYSNSQQKWTPQFKAVKPMEIMLEVKDENFTKEEKLKQVQFIQEKFDEKGIDYAVTAVGYSKSIKGEEDINYVEFTPHQEITIEQIR